jgi:hypothetical protein
MTWTGACPHLRSPPAGQTRKRKARAVLALPLFDSDAYEAAAPAVQSGVDIVVRQGGRNRDTARDHGWRARVCSWRG